jgi:phosphatidylglycerol:prolipoprotein diacylglycerol transferase
VNPAVITFSFDPVVMLGSGASVRIETLALAVVLFAGLVLAARIGQLTPAVGPYVPAPGLRPDDLIFIVVGIVPGALLGGRIGYVIAHLDFYRANPSAIFDVSQGAWELTLAIPFALATGSLIARLVGAPVARWMHALAFPMLFVLALGKLVGVLGADGQGAATSLPWATAYAGPGPWEALAADVPAHPAQVYEAALAFVAIVVLVVLSRYEVIARRDGGALYAAIALWAVVRFVVGFTWRDTAVLGPLRAEQVLALVLLVIAVVGIVERRGAPPVVFEPEIVEDEEDPGQ